MRPLAETVASLPLHLYRYTDTGDGKERATDHPQYKILYRQLNLEMTSFSFREVLMTHLLLWGNAYAQIVQDGKNGILGLYPLLSENVEIDRGENGELYYIYHSYTDEVPGDHDKDILLTWDEVLHIPGLGFNGLVVFPLSQCSHQSGRTVRIDYNPNVFWKADHHGRFPCICCTEMEPLLRRKLCKHRIKSICCLRGF